MSDTAELDVENEGKSQEVIDAEARALGWRPKGEFRGPSEKWVEAAEFLRRGEEILPIVNKQNKELKERLEKQANELSDTRSKLEEATKAIGDFGEHLKRATENSYKRGRADLETERDAAVAQGDTERFKAAQKKIDDLDAEAREVPKSTATKDNSSAPPGKDAPKFDPYINEWVAENPWYNANTEARDFAVGCDMRLMSERPNVPIRERLAEVRTSVQKRFPELFVNPNRERAQSVATPTGSSPAPRDKNAGRRYEDLPSEAKAACDRFVGLKIMSREQYLKDYDWS